MTKQNPDKLCKTCLQFDYAMNRRDGVSFDVLVVCDHDEEEEKQQKEKDDVGSQGKMIRLLLEKKKEDLISVQKDISILNGMLEDLFLAEKDEEKRKEEVGRTNSLRTRCLRGSTMATIRLRLEIKKEDLLKNQNDIFMLEGMLGDMFRNRKEEEEKWMNGLYTRF